MGEGRDDSAVVQPRYTTDDIAGRIMAVASVAHCDKWLTIDFRYAPFATAVMQRARSDMHAAFAIFRYQMYRAARGQGQVTYEVSECADVLNRLQSRAKFD